MDWTPKQDISLVQSYCTDPQAWEQISAQLRKSPINCRNRYMRLKNLLSPPKKLVWKESEDELLIKAVLKYWYEWECIAWEIQGSDPTSCYMRFIKLYEPNKINESFRNEQMKKVQRSQNGNKFVGLQGSNKTLQKPFTKQNINNVNTSAREFIPPREDSKQQRLKEHQIRQQLQSSDRRSKQLPLNQQSDIQQGAELSQKSRSNARISNNRQVSRYDKQLETLRYQRPRNQARFWTDADLDLLKRLYLKYKGRQDLTKLVHENFPTRSAGAVREQIRKVRYHLENHENTNRNIQNPQDNQQEHNSKFVVRGGEQSPVSVSDPASNFASESQQEDKAEEIDEQ